MQLFIKKSSGEKETGRGEAREGKYAQRVVDGYEKDGSPKYKYFKTLDEYKTYLENKNKPAGKASTDKRGGKKKQGKDIKEKVEREQEDTRREQAYKKKDNLLVKKSLYIPRGR